MVHVDLTEKRIEAGVRDLIASGAPLRARGAGGSSLRAHLGSEVHARYRKQREANLGDAFVAERAVRLSLVVDGFDATVTGRIDGVIEDADTVTLEEVKSVVDHGGPESAMARLQVSAYALALHAAGETRRLVLDVVSIAIASGEERRTSVLFDPADTEAQLARLLRGCVRKAENAKRHADARARWAESLAFPHEDIREGQAMLVDAIGDALEEGRPLLAQAPTGTGKTAASLFGAVRFAARDGARVFYATPKTTQHAHVAATFESLCKATPFDEPDVDSPLAVSLHARSRLCTLQSGPCNRRTCPRLANYVERAPPVLDRLAREHTYVSTEALVGAARKHSLCAYELAFDLAQNADLVIGDYNYIFDPSIAMLSRGTRSTVVVVDEAHNLFDRARGYSSARVTLRQVERAEHVLSPADPVAQSTAQWLAELRGAIREATANPPGPNDGGGRLEHQGIFELEFLPVAFDNLARRARLLLLRRLAQAPESWSGGADDPDPVAELLRTVIRCAEATEAFSDDLVAYAIGPKVRGGAGVGVVCIDPARALTERHREAKGTVCMSATLAPLDYWGDILGLEAMDAVQLRVPSPFSPDQRRVVIDPSVSTTYRDRSASLPKIGQSIAEVVALRPGPYMAFFPSFAYLSAVREQLPRLGQVLVQAPRSSLADRKALLDRFVSGKGPRLLLAVSGGVFGEGIDLPGDALLGAFIVGPCLPPIGFQRAAMARYFEATRQAGFAYAMIYPGLQRVVQAAGRVIRREDDRGVVVLLGKRFVRPEIVEALPEDWYSYDPSEMVPEDPIAAIDEFWESC